MERDEFGTSVMLLERISTHTLTWSVTFLKQYLAGSDDISTHTLTWSVTLVASKLSLLHTDFNSHAHVERDRAVPLLQP